MSFFRIILAFALTLVLAAPALAADKEIVFINKTPTKITAIYLSPTGKVDPSPNLLERLTLKRGKNTRIQMPHDMGNCRFDLQYVDNKDKAYTIRDIDICTTNELTIYLKNGEAYAKLK